MAEAAEGEGGGAAVAVVPQIPDSWRVIEVTPENLDRILPGIDKGAFFNEFIRRQKSKPGCGYKAMKPPKKIENIYPTIDIGRPHTQIVHLYLLVDVTTPAREGYGVLALLNVISLNPYNDKGELVQDDMRFSYNDRLFVLPAFIDWTCSFVHEEALGKNLKERVKQNLVRANTSAAKFLTNAVSRMLYEEHRRLFPERPLDGVLLLSVTVESARLSHRKNGKISACSFLDAFRSPVYANMLDLYTARDIPIINNMFNLYLANGQEFAPGNQMYDSLLALGADLHVRKPESKANDYTDDAYTCANPPIEPKNASKGGRRAKSRRRKNKSKKTRRR
jgi:hypothetical protein